MCADALTVRTLLLGVSLGVLGCRAPTSTVAGDRIEPIPSEAGKPSELEDRCLRYSGAPTDPSLRGLTRTHAIHCCASDYGFDPELARDVCGFAEYLGESEELACVHRFRAKGGQLHELRVTPILDLAFDDAVALHELSTGPTEAPAALPELRWSATDDRRWAFVPGWSIVRRLGWDQAACAPERMLPVLARMHASANDPAAGVVLPRLHDDDLSSAPPPAESLLALQLQAPEPNRHYPLPRSAELLVDDLLRAAIANDLEAFATLLEPGARIGLPDRRQLGARAIQPRSDGAAIQQLRDAAARFPIDTALRCPVLDRRVKPQVNRGETSMWCFFISDDGLDLIAFGLRGRVLADRAEADGRVDYLGVFPVRPEAPLTVPGEPPAPPVVPTPELVCGDPHARAYPGACPELELGSDESDDESDDEEP